MYNLNVFVWCIIPVFSYVFKLSVQIKHVGFVAD